MSRQTDIQRMVSQLMTVYGKKSNTDEVGYFNGGCMWTKNKKIPDDWIEFTKRSRYHDQASLEDLARKYPNNAKN